MTNIKILEHDVIDKIAAGEVVERPASVVKELVENAIDAGATAVTAEIQEGGVRLIRVTDNGQGISGEDVRTAFLRHATSKIRTALDLAAVSSLGFRGEALSSIASVSRAEMITKTPDALTGVRYLIEGSEEKGFQEIGAPTGTTLLIRNLFYNTPARFKFLKSASVEGNLVSGLMEHLALSRPDISFKFVSGGKIKLQTAGNGSLKEVIYQVYGRDIASNLIEIPHLSFRMGEEGEIPVRMDGFMGMPVVSRGNRAFETFFVNGRYVKSDLLTRALEDAYKSFLMQHRYPFAVLHIGTDSRLLDVNVHPAKMEIRFSSPEKVYQGAYDGIRSALLQRERIPELSGSEKSKEKAGGGQIKAAPEPFETKRILREKEEGSGHVLPQGGVKPAGFQNGGAGGLTGQSGSIKDPQPDESAKTCVREDAAYGKNEEGAVYGKGKEGGANENGGEASEKSGNRTEQMSLFGTGLLTREAASEHRIIGQVFGTYWLVQYEEELFVIDQHAAHEKVLYERMMRELKGKEMTSQLISPPVVITVSNQEQQILNAYRSGFEALGFEIEPFGGKEYAVRAVPGNLFGLESRELFTELLDSLMDGAPSRDMDSLNERLASMACKAAVKGNQELSQTEARALIGELLELENPYNCPHGRPTIVRMSRRELEKKFKRIV